MNFLSFVPNVVGTKTVPVGDVVTVIGHSKPTQDVLTNIVFLHRGMIKEAIFPIYDYDHTGRDDRDGFLNFLSPV